MFEFLITETIKIFHNLYKFQIARKSETDS